jgi:hypothetical protein
LELGIFKLELGIFNLELGIFKLKILKAGPDRGVAALVIGRLDLDLGKPESRFGECGANAHGTIRQWMAGARRGP